MNNNLCPTCQSPIPADAPGGICPACALLGVANPTSATQVAGASIPALDEIAAAFPELEVLEMCGQGGMGVVFKARQPKLDRLVALKILTPVLAAQPGFAERFTREARALAKLSHPNIVGVHDFGESGGFFYLLMEFVDGVNLRQAIRSGISPEQALLLVPKVCEALQFAHDHGVLHRDIKPENILLDTRGNPKLADFGIAKLGDDKSTGLTLSGAQLGTAAYMAPEQIEHPATVDHRADIYSLGVVLYEMLTGELPLGRFAAPSEKAHCSSGVDDVVLRALEKQRERRQQSATEMKTQVEGAGNIGIVAGRAPDELSKTAVLGMLFVVACIPAGIALFHVAQQFKDTFPKRPATIAAVIPFVVLFALIGSALGWHGVVAIRNSAGRLGGRIAAVIGALFFPVYFPAWFLVANCYDLRTIINRDSGPYSMPGYGTPIAFAAAVTILAIVWLITRVVWRFSCAEKSGVPVRRPEVAAAVPQPPRSAPFSMAAAAGAILSIASIPFGLILFLIVKAILNPPMESGSQLNGPFAGNIVIFGFLPALIGVALGWKAVGDFRYHRGHLRGGGTAVFAALGIPVLAVIVTALANFEDIATLGERRGITTTGVIVASIVVLAAVAASIWAVKALWKFVHHGPPGVPVDQSAASSWPRRLPWIVFGLTFIPGLIVGLGFIFSQMHAAKSRNQGPERTVASGQLSSVLSQISMTKSRIASAERNLRELRILVGDEEPSVKSARNVILGLQEELQVLEDQQVHLEKLMGLEKP